MSINQWATDALIAGGVLTVGKCMDYLGSRRERDSSVELKNAETERAKFEDLTDVARLRLEDYNRVSAECVKLRTDLDDLHTHTRRQETACDDKLNVLRDELDRSGVRYTRLHDDYDELRRRLDRMQRGLFHAGGDDGTEAKT